MPLITFLEFYMIVAGVINGEPSGGRMVEVLDILARP